MYLLYYIILSISAFYLCCQIQLSDIKLLTGLYNYKIKAPQIITYTGIVCATAIIIVENHFFGINSSTLYACISTIPLCVFGEWFLVQLNPSKPCISLLFRIGLTCLIAVLTYLTYSTSSLIPVMIYGLYVRNNPLGSPHISTFIISSRLIRGKSSYLYANKRETRNDMISNTNLPVYNVTDYNIVPDSSDDQLDSVQKLIDMVGEEGGGTIFFPRGRYYFNKSRSNLRFLQINHSDISIEGETDNSGNPLTELIYCNPVPGKAENPWLNPFFITTGELLQRSNIFWGLQFRKRKAVFTQSNSLSDSGSDGTILTPDYSTNIIRPAQKGDNILKVDDSSKLGKYVLIGMYNTTEDGNLLKEILSIDHFRPEWGSALRAGEEEAPSFQYLAEISSIIDSHTIKLAHPLFRPVDLKYAPSVFNAPMVENIHIRNLHIRSSWNGVFHHHGFPIYYSVSQSREMDYGWNCINLKRTAHSSVSNVVIDNFTNPLYVLDSCDSKAENILIKGNNGHQGIKIYSHTCHCHFTNITFLSHYADMMGGEGNAYCNEFSNIEYRSPLFNPVDFDFHGFSEGPMSPPSNNTFKDINNFRYIKGAGAIYNQPALAQNNQWENIITEGERKGHSLFYALSYRPRSYMSRIMAAAGTALVSVLKNKKIDRRTFKVYKDKMQELKRRNISPKHHRKFFKGTTIQNITTTSSIPTE